ncbi:MAG: PAS domain-containing protein [Fibrella sp.]|nr:PAS domain-containing protein [Armatimonadota bacterium]
MRRIFHYALAAMILHHGANFVIDLLNPTAQEMFGPRSVQGKPAREAFPEIETQGMFEFLDRVYATGEPHQAVEMRVLFDRNGGGVPEETFWDVTLQPLNDPGEPTTDILSHAVEVTAQVHARRKLEERDDAS